MLTEITKCVPKDANKNAETIPLENVFKVTLQEDLIKGKSIFQIMTSKWKIYIGKRQLKGNRGVDKCIK